MNAAEPTLGLAERRRRSASLCLRRADMLRRLIELSERSRFAASITPQTRELERRPEAGLQAGRAEYADGERFFRRFEGALSHADLRGRRVLDVGCGYGGRTLYYASACGAREVEGIEPSEAVVERCRALAEALSLDNVRFRIGVAERLPYPDSSFDAVVSFDVLEHVDDPVRAFAETARVLVPGGSAWLVFPTYLGARSSHLDYLTRLPALHRIFDPYVITDVVNDLLARHRDRLGIPDKPQPNVSSLGRLVLPGLNGLTLRDARDLVRRSGLELRREVLVPAVEHDLPVPGASAAAALLRAWRRFAPLPELLVGSIAMHVVRLAR